MRKRLSALCTAFDATRCKLPLNYPYDYQHCTSRVRLGHSGLCAHGEDQSRCGTCSVRRWKICRSRHCSDLSHRGAETELFLRNAVHTDTNDAGGMDVITPCHAPTPAHSQKNERATTTTNDNTSRSSNSNNNSNNNNNRQPTDTQPTANQQPTTTNQLSTTTNSPPTANSQQQPTTAAATAATTA